MSRWHSRYGLDSNQAGIVHGCTGRTWDEIVKENGVKGEDKMSSKPNPDGVKRLRVALRNVVWERARLNAARIELDKAQEEVNRHEEGLVKHTCEVHELMKEMDIQSTGNYGYAERRFEFLLMLAQEGDQ